MSSPESAEPPGWLRLGDLAIGNGGVCVTSLIKDKIREYMLNGDEQQQLQAAAAASEEQPTAAAAADTAEPSRNGGSAAGGACVRRIGNSLDVLLRESRNAGHAVAAAVLRNKRPPSPSTAAAAAAAAADRCAVSTTISAPADSSRRAAANEPAMPPLPPTFDRRNLTVEDEMQISRMPIPADDCGSTEMSVESNASDTKSDTETMAKVNGDCHKSLNGSADDDSKDVDEASEVVVKEKTIKEEEPENKTESLSKCPDEHVKNGEPELQESEKNVEETIEEKSPAAVGKEIKVEPENNEIENVDNDEEKPMKIDESENQQNESIVIIKEELEESEESKSKVTEDIAIPEKEAFLSKEEVNQGDEVIKNNVIKTNPVNGELRLSDEEKNNTTTEKVSQKVSVEEDGSSEISTDTLSPKQIDEPIAARKRSAASHDDLSVVSGASSDNDLPKIKKLRSEEEVPIIKDDTRERLIKNIVQSCGKNEVELTKNIDKIQNEIKVITEIAQTKRDELVTLIRLQKLKEEIIERLMIKMKELDAVKIDNSKDWNLPEMFQINLSQPELILSEKNISDIIDSRETPLDKSAIVGYDQNSYTTSLSNMSVNSVSLASNSQSNDWIMADRANRVNRGQRIILPKPTVVNNGKEGRQGPTLDVKLLIADHRSKNPETAVPKRGRRKAPVNEFSVPTSSAPLRYPNPMGFGNPMHHVNDGHFKTTITNSHGVPNNVVEHGSEHNRFKDVPAFPEVTLHPVAQTLQSHHQHQQQQPTSLLHGILTKGAGTHHLPITMSNTPTNYSPTLARLLTAPERCKQSRGKQRQTTPAATVVSSNTQSRNEITITPVQSTSMSSTFQQKPNVTSNVPPPAQVDDEDISDRLVIDEGQDVANANSPSSAPQCQGCLQKPAQFVCAGCGNQWYCSKDCQIDAWDEHSEVCNG